MLWKNNILENREEEYEKISFDTFYDFNNLLV